MFVRILEEIFHICLFFSLSFVVKVTSAITITERNLDLRKDILAASVEANIALNINLFDSIVFHTPFDILYFYDFRFNST